MTSILLLFISIWALSEPSVARQVDRTALTEPVRVEPLDLTLESFTPSDHRESIRFSSFTGARRFSSESFDRHLHFASRDQEEFPDPNSVLYRSMMVPGWGQITNRQIWKVPVIYAMFAGLGYYTYDLTRKYHGFRAAYYNETREGESDYKYGPTPDFVPEDMPPEQMRSIRDDLRNSRDLSYVYIVLAYGLNILDAYVYAHMRTFDVSDDLSANAAVTPDITEHGAPGVRLRISLFQR